MLQTGHGSDTLQHIMRLILLLAGLLLLLDLTWGQRPHWRRRGPRSRGRARRYNQSHRRGSQRHREDSYEGDNLRLSSTELSRRVNKFEKRERRYYPDNLNNLTSRIIQESPEYRVQTRGGDTIIEFARSGEAQGKSFLIVKYHLMDRRH